MSASAEAGVLETFRSKFKKEWKQKPICEVHRKSYHCHCRRPFISTASLEQWMDEKADGTSKTNGEHLLDEVDPIKLTFSSDPRSIFKGNKRCVLVFSCLLMQNHGQFIYIFQSSEIIDKNLDAPKHNRQMLLERLRDHKHEHNIDDVDAIIDNFEKKKWAFCPARLNDELRGKRFENMLILPFCARDIVNDKGGTASVFQVTVQKEFVSDEIKSHLGQPFKFRKYGEVSTIDDKGSWQIFKLTSCSATNLQ
jgi:hypothetical protein